MKSFRAKHHLLTILLIAVILGATCIANHTFTSALTYQNSVDVEFTFNPAISISLSDADLIINNLTPGSSSDSNIITVGVSTNAGYGYYMTATVGTSTGNTNLNSTTTSNVFTNLSSNAATLNDIPADRWGYSYSKDNGTTWVSGDTNNTSTGYNGLPLDNNDNGATGVALLQTDSYTNSNSIKFKIAAHASPTQATGTYTNVINFYAVANPEPTLGPESCTAGKICYHKNALTTVEGTMGEQTAASDGNTTTLLASNFSRTGYGFAGWSDTYDYSGNLYGPQEDITVPTGTASNGLSLYAIWVRSAGSMQSDAASVCSGLTAATSTTKTLSSVSALTDQRDNNTYAIAKLADGKCWMIENLRLDSTADHNSDGSLAQGYGTSTTYGNFGGLADAESTNFSDSTTANSLYYSGTQSGTASINIGTTNNPGYRMPRYNNLNTTNRASNPTSNSFADDNTTGGMYSYGNYYTWHAAIADLTYNGTNNNSTTSTSLCPAGWHLPKGGSDEANNEFGSLVDGSINGNTKPANYDSSTRQYFTSTPGGVDASNILRAYPNNFLYSGGFTTSSADYRGSNGLYWSSTAGDSSSSYGLLLNSSDVRPGRVDKYFGFSIRCTVSAGT